MSWETLTDTAGNSLPVRANNTRQLGRPPRRVSDRGQVDTTDGEASERAIQVDVDDAQNKTQPSPVSSVSSSMPPREFNRAHRKERETKKRANGGNYRTISRENSDSVYRLPIRTRTRQMINL